MKKLLTITLLIISLFFSGCDPMLRLMMKPEASSFKPIENDLMWHGGFTLDTAGIKISVRSFLFHATKNRPTSEFYLDFKIKSDKEFYFPLSKCILTDSTFWKRRPFGVYSNTERIKDDHIFQADENIEVALGIDDGVLLIYPSRIILPPIFFISLKDSLHLPEIIIEGFVSDTI